MTNTTEATTAIDDPCTLCEGTHHFSNCPSHACTGDNCYCIGGDENFDALWDDAIMASLAGANP